MEPGETNRILPDDLLDGILVRLPVRELLRFRCVSKSWRVLIDSSRFIGMHHHAQYAMRKAEGDVPYLLWSLPIINSFECYLLSKKQGDDIVLNLKTDVVRDRRSAFIDYPDMNLDMTACRGSANGIICLEIGFADVDWVKVCYCGLWNPATRDCKIVLHPDVPEQLGPGSESFCVIGFTFDPLSNDFRILAKTTLDPTLSDKVFAYEVYSLSTNSWKRLSEPSLLGFTASVRLPTMDACFNGVHYWIASIVRNTELPVEAKRAFWILSFNFSTEVFKLSDPPQGVVLPPLDYDSREYVWEIGLYKEFLALFFTHRSLDESVASVDIWAVKEFDDDFGAPLAWQCLFSTGSISVLSWHTLVRAPRLDGDLLFIMKDMLLYIYNPTTGLCKVLKCTKTPTAAEFTLHGVWPISGGGKLPCSSQPYDSTILKPLEKDLVKFWPSFIYQKDDQFWSHEWSKHGTCSGHSLFDYFKLSVALAKNQCLKIKDDLRISAIVPSATQTHAMKDYEQGIATAYGMGSVYQIVCQKDSSFAYLVEVRLCVDSSMQQLIFCPQSPGDKFPGCSDATGLVKALFYA